MGVSDGGAGGARTNRGKGLWMGAGLASIALAATLSVFAASMAVDRASATSTGIVSGVSQMLAEHIAIGETRRVGALYARAEAERAAAEQAEIEAAQRAMAEANEAAAALEPSETWPEGSLGDAMRRHIVWGDTLSEIAEEEGTTVRRLAYLNGIENVDLIYAGDWLTIG